MTEVELDKVRLQELKDKRKFLDEAIKICETQRDTYVKNIRFHRQQLNKMDKQIEKLNKNNRVIQNIS